jgi:predicted dinucleotide-binding enzyme
MKIGIIGSGAMGRYFEAQFVKLGHAVSIANSRADGDEEVHRVLTTKIFPRHADVLMVDDWNNR